MISRYITLRLKLLPGVIIWLCMRETLISCNVNGADAPLDLCHYPPCWIIDKVQGHCQVRGGPLRKDKTVRWHDLVWTGGSAGSYSACVSEARTHKSPGPLNKRPCLIIYLTTISHAPPLPAHTTLFISCVASGDSVCPLAIIWGVAAQRGRRLGEQQIQNHHRRRLMINVEKRKNVCWCSFVHKAGTYGMFTSMSVFFFFDAAT